MAREWFDPHNIDHCKAYRHLQKTGLGRKINWQVNIMAKCTKAWIDQILEYSDYVEMNKEEAEKFEEGKDQK